MRRWILGPAAVLAGVLAASAAAQEGPKRTPEQEAQIARAREILEEARKAAFTVPAEQSRERGLLLQGIAIASAEAGDVAGALLTLAALEAEHPQAKGGVLMMVAVAQARAGEVSAALDTLSGVEHEGMRSMAMLHVVSQLAQEGYWGPARQFIDQIEEERYKDRALASLAFNQLSAGDIPGARLTADEIADEDVKERVTKSITALEGQPHEKRSLQLRAGQFPAVTLGPPGVRPETASFRVWMPSTGLLVAANESDDATVTQIRETVRTAVKEKDEGDKATTLGSLQEAARLAQALEDESDRADQLWFVAAAQAELGESEQALATSRMLHKEGYDGAKTTMTRVLCLRHIAMSQAAAGRLDEALAWAEAEPDTAHRAVALLGAAEGLLRRVELDSWPQQMHEHLRNEQR